MSESNHEFADVFTQRAADVPASPPLAVRYPFAIIRHSLDQLVVELSEMAAQRDKLQQFKDYVHARLDAAGVSADPESPHKTEGCRIGGRLDELIGERDALRAKPATAPEDDGADRDEFEDDEPLF